MTRWRNGPPQCPLCMYKHWDGMKGSNCDRCKRTICAPDGTMLTESQARWLDDRKKQKQAPTKTIIDDYRCTCGLLACGCDPDEDGFNDFFSVPC